MTYKTSEQLNKLREMIADVDCEDNELNARFYCKHHGYKFIKTTSDNKAYFLHDNIMYHHKITNYTKSLDALYELIPDGLRLDISINSLTTCVHAYWLASDRIPEVEFDSIDAPTIYKALMDAVAQAIDYDRWMENNNG